jgi:hypothetical protein
LTRSPAILATVAGERCDTGGIVAINRIERWASSHADALAVVAVALIAWLVTPRLPALDDAYIVLHSADVVRVGGDSVYGVPALSGITSPAYLLLVLALQAFGADGLGALRIAGALGVTAYLAGVWFLAKEVRVTGLRAVVVLTLGLLSGPVAKNLTNGLETGWASALVVWAVIWTLQHRPLRVAVLMGILPWLRPDLAPMAAVLLVLAARPLGPQWWRPLIVALFVMLPFTIWVRWDTGYWWPQTIDAKRLFFAEGCLPAMMKIERTLQYLWSWANLNVLIIVGLGVAFVDPLGRMGLLSSIVILTAYGWTLPGGITHNDYRYLTPFLIPWGLLGFARMVRSSRGPATAALLGIILFMAVKNTSQRPFLNDHGEAQELKLVGEWIETHTAADAAILVHDAGAMSVFAHRRLVDIVGLKTPSSVDAHARWTWPTCGEDRALAVDSIARSARPQFLVVANDWDRIFRFSGALSAHGWHLTMLRAHTSSPRSYAVYRLAFDGSR